MICDGTRGSWKVIFGQKWDKYGICLYPKGYWCALSTTQATSAGRRPENEPFCGRAGAQEGSHRKKNNLSKLHHFTMKKYVETPVTIPVPFDWIFDTSSAHLISCILQIVHRVTHLHSKSIQLLMWGFQKCRSVGGVVRKRRSQTCTEVRSKSYDLAHRLFCLWISLPASRSPAKWGWNFARFCWRS